MITASLDGDGPLVDDNDCEIGKASWFQSSPHTLGSDAPFRSDRGLGFMFRMNLAGAGLLHLV